MKTNVHMLDNRWIEIMIPKKMEQVRLELTVVPVYTEATSRPQHSDDEAKRTSLAKGPTLLTIFKEVLSAKRKVI